MPLLSRIGSAASRGFGLFGLSKILDPYFKYVTLLLHGDGTNGAQNNTFLDSSTNNFTITRNGNTTQGTFSPYGNNWGNYFDGTSNSYISAPSNTALDLNATACTIEGWIYPTRVNNGAQSGFRNIISKRVSGSITTNYNIMLWFNSEKIGFFNGSTSSLSTANIAQNTWTHFAYTFDGTTTLKLWINGVLDSTFTTSFGANNSATLNIGSNFDDASTYDNFGGYISNIRIVKGSQLYTTTFTPSTTPLTAITNTSLLTCQSNRFIDNSSNALAITTVGSPSIQRFSPFSPSSAYSTSVIGGSGYFNGSTDSLAVPANTAFAFGQGDLTVQMWIYPIATITSPANIGLFYIDQTNGLVVGLSNGYIAMGSRAVSYDLTSTYIPPLNTWTHIAATRSGATAYIFANGVLVGTVTSSGGNPSNNANYVCTTGLPTIAGNYGGGTGFGYFPGYISNVQVVKGTAVYTSAFTPPTAPVTAITNTSLLLNYTNGGIYDNAEMNDLQTVGDAQVSTTQVKFGTGSMKFDGTGDYLKTLNNGLLTLGTGDFTVEFWLYPTTVATSYQGLIDWRPSDTSTYPAIFLNTSAVVWGKFGGAMITSSAISATTWTHIAVCRSGTSTKMFINGTQSGSTYTDTNNYLGNTTVLIGSTFASEYFNGYIDDLRITKGYARYTSNFTPPTAAFPNQ